jgi:hypothetical protein
MSLEPLESQQPHPTNPRIGIGTVNAAALGRSDVRRVGISPDGLGRRVAAALKSKLELVV